MGDLLIVDDEEMLAENYARFFTRRGHTVRVASSGAEALARFADRRPDVLLLDVNLPDMSGFDVFDRLKGERPVVVMISGHAEVPMAVRAVQEGAETFLTKPVDLNHLEVAIERALETVRLRLLTRYVNERRSSTGRVALGSSPAMRELAAQVELLAATDRTAVLILGETGTGKGRIAELIHADGVRASGPFTEAHCSGVSESALEAELFGVEDTGAGDPRPGLVEVAAGGTLFLDEIGDLPLALQPRLLRLLEGRPVRRAGGTRDVVCNVRLIAATSRDLIALVNAGRFREDLYYRLSVMPVRLPPLRDRSREDLVELVARLMDELAPQLPAAPRHVDDAVLDRLLRHTWTGNIRELRNVLERAMLVARGRETLDMESLPVEFRARGASAEDGTRTEMRSLEDVERDHITRTLRAVRGNRSQAARVLGISRATLIKKIRDYGLAALPSGST